MLQQVGTDFDPLRAARSVRVEVLVIALFKDDLCSSRIVHLAGKVSDLLVDFLVVFFVFEQTEIREDWHDYHWIEPEDQALEDAGSQEAN